MSNYNVSIFSFSSLTLLQQIINHFSLVIAEILKFSWIYSYYNKKPVVLFKNFEDIGQYIFKRSINLRRLLS